MNYPFTASALFVKALVEVACILVSGIRAKGELDQCDVACFGEIDEQVVIPYPQEATIWLGNCVIVRHNIPKFASNCGSVHLLP